MNKMEKLSEIIILICFNPYFYWINIFIHIKKAGKHLKKELVSILIFTGSIFLLIEEDNFIELLDKEVSILIFTGSIFLFRGR